MRLAITEVRSVGACLFAGTWHHLVHGITTLYYVAIVIFHCRVWYHMLSLRYV